MQFFKEGGKRVRSLLLLIVVVLATQILIAASKNNWLLVSIFALMAVVAAVTFSRHPRIDRGHWYPLKSLGPYIEIRRREMARLHGQCQHVDTSVKAIFDGILGVCQFELATYERHVRGAGWEKIVGSRQSGTKAYDTVKQLIEGFVLVVADCHIDCVFVFQKIGVSSTHFFRHFCADYSLIYRNIVL